MDSLENLKPKAKRVRCNPTKKWTLAEDKALVEFLMANRDFEKPMAQDYYRRYSQEANVDIDWKLIRAKVRNMRVSYNKSKVWEGSIGAGSMEGETIRTTLLKMCTFFYDFDDIFGSRLIETAIIEESLDTPTENFFNSTQFDIEEATTPSTSVTPEFENTASNG